nr:hypothetical protein [Frankia gtarii]
MWDQTLLDHSIRPVQVFSDSDFTRLAERIREAGLTLYGFGEQMMYARGR